MISNDKLLRLEMNERNRIVIFIGTSGRVFMFRFSFQRNIEEHKICIISVTGWETLCYQRVVLIA